MESMIMQNPLTVPRVDKTIDWLKRSRDQWKDKCIAAKLQLKRQTLAVKRSRDGRIQMKTELKALKKRNRELESKVQSQHIQISELKKKPSSKKMT
jgi:predicted RNase H-like nuclease (RuvC/YqgF family)